MAKINADLSSKDRLIQENENSRNPFEGGNDYKYQRFQDNYNRKQKMIDDNIDKYFPIMYIIIKIIILIKMEEIKMELIEIIMKKIKKRKNI